MASFADALAINNRLKELNLGYLMHVTFTMRWKTVSTILQNLALASKQLDLIFFIDNHAILFLSDVLANNPRPTEVRLSHNTHATTTRWLTLLTVLQRPTSASKNLI
jgi:hypothetical protein